MALLADEGVWDAVGSDNSKKLAVLYLSFSKEGS
jgi:hypothetical protein